MIEPLQLTGDVQGALLRPDEPTGPGVIVLTGSSGRVDVDRARLFAERGAVALAQRWWGGEGQAPGINHIPIEVIVRGIDRLQAEGCDRIALLGVSRGAEAVLLTAARDARVELVIAVSPSAVVWQNMGPGLKGELWPPRSSFTWQGVPLPFIVYDPRPWPAPGPAKPSFRRVHEQSLITFAEDVPAASIPIEQARAEIILVAGGADLVWPSVAAARQIAARLASFGKAATVIEHAGAGHSPVFPGEPVLPEPADHAWGGEPAADRELGAMAWAEITRRLALTP